jgi:L-ascorbate metabolism protein UlaG (beta-lactamase superfamily)
MNTLSFTWLGHGTFLFRSPGGKRILIDPWIATNPVCPEESRKIRELDLLLLTHGHDDHTADAVSIGRATGARVIAPYELGLWMEQKGLQAVTPMNRGGTIEAGGLSITMVPAFHSSSIVEDGRIVYLGEPCGYVIRFEDGATIYFAGDTAVFGDMRLIGERYRPDLALVPIGGHFTMDPGDAAWAMTQLLKPRAVIPMHYGTNPLAKGTAKEFVDAMGSSAIKVIVAVPGQTLEF